MMKVIFTLFLIGVLTGAMMGGLAYRYIKTEIWPSDEVNINLSQMPVNLSSKLYYRNGETGEYQEWVTLKNSENRVWVDYDDIPIDFQHAFVAIEDQRFYTHQGVDWKRTVAASVNLLTGRRIFGGSTITQQLIKNLTNDKEVTIHRKLVEICRALKLEQRYSKEQILEWYMNIIYFGRGQYGIGAAARHYFDKDVSELTLAEMCSIAGITNNPSKYDPYNFPENNDMRKTVILDKMFELGYITVEEYTSAKNEKVSFVSGEQRSKAVSEVYPYYVDTVVDDVIAHFQDEYQVSKEQATTMLYYGGYNIYTCVDMDVQKKMDSVYQDTDKIPTTKDNKRLQSSMVVMDPYSGDIVGIEGGVGKKEVARGLNWATSNLGRRPPGSSIKPIAVYGPAIDRGLITPNSQFLDSSDIQLKGTSWFPKNDSGKNYGVVSIRNGIVRSLNTISAQVLDLLTPSVSFKFLTDKLHMHLEVSDKDYAPLATGQLTTGTTTREMASAYSIFPNDGIYTEGRTFSEIYDNDWNLVFNNKPKSHKAISAKTACWVTDMLTDAVAWGTGTSAKLSGMSCAGKTGTTTSNKDRWFAGYTPYYVGVVWTGYEKPSKIRVSGNPAAKLWKSVMLLIHEGKEDIGFNTPADISLTPVPGPGAAYIAPEEPEQDEVEGPEDELLDGPDSYIIPPVVDEPLDEPYWGGYDVPIDNPNGGFLPLPGDWSSPMLW